MDEIEYKHQCNQSFPIQIVPSNVVGAYTTISVVVTIPLLQTIASNDFIFEALVVPALKILSLWFGCRKVVFRNMLQGRLGPCCAIYKENISRREWTIPRSCRDSLWD